MRFFLKPAFYFIRHNWKSPELQWMSFAIFISVISITTMVFLTESFNSVLNDKSGALLGSDRVITSPARIDPLIRDHASSMHLKTTTTLSFLTMLVHKEALALADVKAVENNYPLRGELRTASALFLPDVISKEIPLPGTAWVEARLFPLLDLKINDRIGIGETTLLVTKVLTSEPDRTLEGINLAPRMLINAVDVPATKMIQPGSRVNYKLLLAGNDTTLKQFEAWVLPKLTPLQKFVDTRHSRPTVDLTLQRINNYLGLIFFINISLVGVAIAMCARRFSQGQFDIVALLRCFGASDSWILRHYVLGLLLMGLGVGLVGIVCGFWGKQLLIHFVFKEMLYGSLGSATAFIFPSITELRFPVFIGLLTVLILLFAFAVPSILRLSKITPLRVLRRDLPLPGMGSWFGLVLALTAVSILTMFQTQNIVFTLSFVLSTLAISIVLLVLIDSILQQISKFSRSFSIAFQLNFRNLVHRSGENTIQILAFGLVISLLCTMFLVRLELLKTWQAQVPKDAPNYFVLNIPPESIYSFQSLLEQHTIKTAMLYPMLAGRLMAINDDPVEMGIGSSSKKRAVNRLLNLTWVYDLQKDNRIVEGQWFKESDHGQPIISVEHGFADRLNIKLGDILKFQIAEKTIDSTVTSIRTVEWDSFQPNFYVIFPPGVIDTFPMTYMTSFYLASNDIAFLKNLIQKFPMVNIIDTQMLVGQLKRFLNSMSWIVQYLWGFTLVTSFILLFATIASTLDERKNEAKILRILGITNKQLQGILLSEFLVLGFIAGVLGVISANGIVYWLARFIFDLPFQVNIPVLLGGPLLGMGLIVLGGWWGTRSVFLMPPLRVE